MLVPMNELLQDALRGDYAVGAFDVPTVELGGAVLEAAAENSSPVIVAIPGSLSGDARFGVLVGGVRDLAMPLRIPVAVILDHGRSFEAAMRGIRAGVTAVMFDGSALPYEENARITRQVAEVAHAVGVSVEGEIGRVGLAAEYETSKEGLTKPEEALQFVRDTGVDALAVAVGTAHGSYKGEPTIHYDLLATIREAVGCPLVLHGGSSTGDERLRRAIPHGIAKINIFTDMSDEAKRRIRRTVEGRWERARINDLLREAGGAFKDVASHYIRLFGSAGRA